MHGCREIHQLKAWDQGRTYPNQMAFAPFSFLGSVPHVGVCFGIKDLTFRGGLGARRVSLKRNWMGAVVVSAFTYHWAS